MPSYVIVPGRFDRIGETTDATLCDLGVAGFPDHRTDVPVRVKRISEEVLSVDGEPRALIWSEGREGVTTFLVDGGGLRNRQRRVALAQALGLLQQLRSTLMLLAGDSAAPEVVAEALQELFDWIASEREAAVDAPKGGPHADAR